MYSQAENITLSYLNTLNQLIFIINNNKTIIDYDIKKIINESIRNIENNGGSVRAIEDGLLSLVNFNEKLRSNM